MVYLQPYTVSRPERIFGWIERFISKCSSVTERLSCMLHSSGKISKPSRQGQGKWLQKRMHCWLMKNANAKVGFVMGLSVEHSWKIIMVKNLTKKPKLLSSSPYVFAAFLAVLKSWTIYMKRLIQWAYTLRQWVDSWIQIPRSVWDYHQEPKTLC